MKFVHETYTDSPRSEVFDWFEHKGSFRRLMPPWEVAEEVRADDTLDFALDVVAPMVRVNTPGYHPGLAPTGLTPRVLTSHWM